MICSGGCSPTIWGNSFAFFGLILLMATVGAGFSQESFWQPYHERAPTHAPTISTATCPELALNASNRSFDSPTRNGAKPTPC
ncbi:hypothetical protein ACHAWO_004354 [Cyclotella atomus]|uniref:Uncharacterized protein n=1 Tax=Cyclotella atomus TaxID=382360 RepID=A0ABD3N8Q4_9STRA